MADTTTHTAPDAVDRAAQAVPAARFHGTNGKAVRPCTPATHRHLRMLDVPPGGNVLEIGVGSGYSAALLAQLVGPDRQATALDISPELTDRARALYAQHGDRVLALNTDGMRGHPDRAPYDRIFSSAPPRPPSPQPGSINSPLAAPS